MPRAQTVGGLIEEADNYLTAADWPFCWHELFEPGVEKLHKAVQLIESGATLQTVIKS